MDAPNPCAAPAAATVDPAGEVASPERIAALPVSDAWKARFRLISAAGGARLPLADRLPGGERLAVSFNLPAFVLGPLWFLAKGLWRQAITMSALSLLAMTVVGIVLGLVGLAQVAPLVGWACMAVFGARANVAYYVKMALGRKVWL